MLPHLVNSSINTRWGRSGWCSLTQMSRTSMGYGSPDSRQTSDSRRSPDSRRSRGQLHAPSQHFPRVAPSGAPPLPQAFGGLHPQEAASLPQGGFDHG